MTSIIRADVIENPAGTTSINISDLQLGIAIKQISREVNTTTSSISTSWSLGPSFNGLSNCSANSWIRMTYFFPFRNDDTGWGGTYVEPQIQINSGTWQSLGSSGYDGNTMYNSAASIATYTNTILINPEQVNTFNIAVRFYLRTYSGTTTLNGSHDINATSNTATIMSGINGEQHYNHIIMEEISGITEA